jgi:hypothetical protein
MKKLVFLSVAGVAVAIIITSSTMWGRGGMGGGARGGGGGGGARAGGGAFGGGGGMHGGGGNLGGGTRPSFGSAPAMSRPSSSGTRPNGGGHLADGGRNRASIGTLPAPGGIPAQGANRPSGGNVAANRPSIGERPGAGNGPNQAQLQHFLNLSGGEARPGGALAGGALAGGAAAEFLRDRPAGERPAGGGNRPERPGQGGGGEQLRPGGENRPNRPDNRPGGDRWAQYHPAKINNWNQWNNSRHNNFVNINNNWNNHWHNNWNNCNNWFNRNWWRDHPCDGWRWPVNANWWRWATWPTIGAWLHWRWTQPVYYDYGNNVYYQNDYVYYGDQPVATADEYAQQAEAIALSVPQNVQPAAEDWMPLGVFAVTQDGESAGDDPTMFLQLAVSKQGIIAGTFQNTASGTVKSIEGMVDKETQRAAWTPIGESRPLMETGITNLTQDTAGVLVHFANGDTQQWLLTRLNDPTVAGAPR